MSIALLAAVVAVLNINAATVQCVDYQCRDISIPLYSKVLNFLSRHFDYNRLAGSIVSRRLPEKEKAMRVFNWTLEHIKSVPRGFPVVDDHSWYIIVRGYGTDDQFQDVFTTLCNYSGLDAFFDGVSSKDRSKNKSLSFVRIDKKWRVFDPFNGAYLIGPDGDLAGIEDVLSGGFTVFSKNSEARDIDYAKTLRTLKIDKRIKGWTFSRAAIQSPLRRFIFWLKTRK